MKKSHWLFAVLVLMALCWAGWSGRAQSSLRWEYKVITTSNHHALGLDQLGDQGWELIAIAKNESASAGARVAVNDYFFKRQR
ncbi:MAG: hypothetical protein AB1631_10535 [Acidobacteriota bacterium]